MKQYINQSIPWHWHPALEIDYVVKDEVQIRMYDSMITLKKGQAADLPDLIRFLPGNTDDGKNNKNGKIK